MPKLTIVANIKAKSGKIELVKAELEKSFPWYASPRHLLRVRDGVCGAAFQRRAASLGFHQVLTVPRSPWQNSPAVYSSDSN